MMRDLKTGLDFASSIAPAAAVAATVNGAAVDLQGYSSVAVAFNVGALTDGTHTPKVQESADGSTNWTDVAAADLLGALVAIAASTNQRVGYIGSKRYIRAVSTVTGSPATGAFYSAIVLRSGANNPLA